MPAAGSGVAASGPAHVRPRKGSTFGRIAGRAIRGREHRGEARLCGAAPVLVRAAVDVVRVRLAYVVLARGAADVLVGESSSFIVPSHSKQHAAAAFFFLAGEMIFHNCRQCDSGEVK